MILAKPNVMDEGEFLPRTGGWGRDALFAPAVAAA